MSVCLSGYAFRRALTRGADIWHQGRDRQPEVHYGVFEATR